MESPNKRRRLSNDVYEITESNVEGDHIELQQPTTPKRKASYLSPTKSSLARSHPNVLAKSPKRGSLTEPRGKLLRQELLGSKKSAKTSGSVPKSAPRPSLIARTDVLEAEGRASSSKDGFAEAIARSFQAAATKTEQPDRRTRSPLRTRQPSSTLTKRHPYDQIPQPTAPKSLPVPKLVTRKEVPVQQQSDARNEPELPPTPIQLGLGRAPDRPRGLASSSSIGSKSGSGKHRRRVRDSNGASVTSSPLKTRNNRPVSPTDFSDDEAADMEAVEEAPESDVEGSQRQAHTLSNNNTTEAGGRDLGELSTELRKKLEERQMLIFRQMSWQEDLAMLESVTTRIERGEDVNMGPSILSILASGDRSADGDFQSPESHPVFIKNASIYLQLFQPCNVQLEHETSTKYVEKRLKVIHTLRLNPLIAWPREPLSLSLDVEIDAEDARIDKIVRLKPGNLLESNMLQRWIEQRLRSDLYKYNLGAMVWGAGQYFEASLTRAKAFRHLDTRYNDAVDIASLELTQKGECLTTKDVAQLNRYILETQLTISTQDSAEVSAGSRPTRSRTKNKQIMVTYEIDLDWMGGSTNQIDICLTGVSAKAQKGAKELFMKLLPTQGLIKAFEGVWAVLGWDGAHNEAKDLNKRVAKSRK